MIYATEKKFNIYDYSICLTYVDPLLKVPSYKLYNSKYMIVSTQITNTEIFAFMAVLVFKLMSL